MNIDMNTVMHCQMACKKIPACTVFQYQKFTKTCELKTHQGTNITDNNMIVGPDECGYMKGNLAFNASFQSSGNSHFKY